jgi:hypothetical protein
MKVVFSTGTILAIETKKNKKRQLEKNSTVSPVNFPEIPESAWALFGRGVLYSIKG